MKQKNIYDIALYNKPKMFGLAISNDAILSVALFETVMHSDFNKVTTRQ